MKTWFITGASSGFGRELATAVLQGGDRAVLAARRPEALADLVAAHPGKAAAVALDVTDPAQCADAVAQAFAWAGRLDVLVNNAGYGLLAALEETDDARLARNLETNLTGPLRIIRAAIPRLRAQGGGHIINMSSIAAFANEMGFSVYGAAKAGLMAAADALAGELAPFRIRITTVLPGPFRTDFIGRSLDAAPHRPEYADTVGRFEAFLHSINGRQPGDPRRAAQAILAIAGSDAPPAHLVLGRFAHDKFASTLDALRQDLAGWEHLGLPTDFPEA